MSTAQIPRLYTPGEIAAKFRVHPSAVKRWTRNGRIPREHVVPTPGGHRRVHADYIDALLRGES